MPRIADSTDLVTMLQTYEEFDLNFSVGHPLQVEDFGELKPVFVGATIEPLHPIRRKQIAPHAYARQSPFDL